MLVLVSETVVDVESEVEVVVVVLVLVVVASPQRAAVVHRVGRYSSQGRE